MKKLIVVLAVFTILIIGIAGYIIYKDINSPETAESLSSADVDLMREAAGGSVTEKEMEAFKAQGKNPFGQLTTMEQLTDIDYQEYIHGMSHQKVEAVEKWGFYHINIERITWLLDGLNHIDLKHESIYREILEKWANGDFSTADQDHNTIWRLQGGTIGKATGVLSSDDEKAYIESQE